MTDFFVNLLDWNRDGALSAKESLAAAAAVLVFVLAVVFAAFRLAERSHIRKTSIFRVKKNRYKSRLGKKNIKY